MSEELKTVKLVSLSIYMKSGNVINILAFADKFSCSIGGFSKVMKWNGPTTPHYLIDIDPNQVEAVVQNGKAWDAPVGDYV